MGQTQIKQNNSIQTLIKDIEQINRISKLIPQELNITIQADLVQNQSKNSLIKFFSKVEICIMFKVNQNTKYMTIENFEKIKPLLNDLAYILNKKLEDEICFICFEQKREKILTCGHSYCSNCIDGWFNNKDKDSCPMCRTRITKQKMLTESYCLPNDSDLIESLIQQILDSNNYY